ncbi:minor capsid protein [Peptostreptococcus equinus]|uniref:Minor capsid protein n=1 Tax=Peptostreptococcus equinus TaxID=3003601 RepID=A0ABY7JPI6_9FIRM|nr:minor capsid protein [Peptostreptococcus sp. CBA3647]WAW15281.1 minor capsid protein [Peptostreptococcus sp. CBA3647]
MAKITKIDEYWINRAKERNKANIRASDDVVKLISQQYEKALKNIEKEIATLFYRYSEDNGLSYTRATELLKGNAIKGFRMDLKEYMELIDDPNILLELNTLSTRSRISNLEASFFSIQKELDKAYMYQFEEVETLMYQSTADNYYKTMFDVAVVSSFVPRDFHKLTKAEIIAEFSKPWSGRNFSERLWKNRSKLKDAIEEEIIQGAIRGVNPQQTTKRIVEKFDVSKKTASRLVHTEQQYFATLGQKKAYNELNLDRYIYIATLDIKTSEICRSLDHDIFYVKDMQSGVNAPPMHPHCRSATAPYLGELKGTRVARDKAGNNVKVDKNMNYEEWYKQNVESDSEYKKEEKKWKNRHADKKQHQKDREKYGSDIPRSFKKYQDLKYNDPDKLKEIGKKKK